MAELGRSDVVNQAKSVDDRYSSIDESGNTHALNSSTGGEAGNSRTGSSSNGNGQEDVRDSKSSTKSAALARDSSISASLPNYSTSIDIDRFQQTASNLATVTDSSSVNTLVNGDAASFHGSEETGYQRSNGPGSDTESKGDLTGSSGENWSRRERSNSIKKPASFKPVSVTKNFLAKTVGAGTNSTSKLIVDKGSSSSPSPQPARPRLVAKSGRDSRTNLNNGSSTGGGFGSNPVWNRNKPAPPTPQKQFTDEELKQHYGIHMATRLQADEAGKESKWADIDDDEDDWAPETVEWMDGTKSTIVASDNQPSQTEKSKSQVNNKQESSNVAQSSTNTTLDPSAPANNATLTAPAIQRPSSMASSIGKTILRPGARVTAPTRPGLVLRTVPENKHSHDAGKSYNTSSTLTSTSKSPWAPIPPVETAHIPLNLTSTSQQQQQAPKEQPQQQLLGGYHSGRRDSVGNESGDARSVHSQQAREIAADDFDRSWRDTERPSRELFNSQSGRYEPVKTMRRGSRHDPGFRPPAVLQRPSQQGVAGTSPGAVNDRREPSAGRSSQMGSQDARSWLNQRRESSSTESPIVTSADRHASFENETDLPASISASSKWQADTQQAPPSTAVEAVDSARATDGGTDNEKARGGSTSEVKPYSVRGPARGGEAAAGSAAAGPDARAVQQQLMRERIELNRKRKQEEEAREEAARKERIRLRMAALGPAPEIQAVTDTATASIAPSQENPPSARDNNGHAVTSTAEQGIVNSLSSSSSFQQQETKTPMSSGETKEIFPARIAERGKGETTSLSAPPAISPAITVPSSAAAATTAAAAAPVATISNNHRNKEVGALPSITPSQSAPAAAGGKINYPASFDVTSVPEAQTYHVPPLQQTSTIGQPVATIGNPQPSPFPASSSSLPFSHKSPLKYQSEQSQFAETSSTKNISSQHLPGLGQFPPSSASSSAINQTTHFNSFGNTNTTNSSSAALSSSPSSNNRQQQVTSSQIPASSSAVDPSSSWSNQVYRQPSGQSSLVGNVWGPPANDRLIGNGAFDKELHRVPQPSVQLPPHHLHASPDPSQRQATSSLAPPNTTKPDMSSQVSSQTSVHPLARLYGFGNIYESFDPTKYSKKNSPNTYADRDNFPRRSPAAEDDRSDVASWNAFAANPAKYDKAHDDFVKMLDEAKRARDAANGVVPAPKMWTVIHKQIERDEFGNKKVVSVHTEQFDPEKGPDDETDKQANVPVTATSAGTSISISQSGNHPSQAAVTARSRFFPGADRNIATSSNNAENTRITSTAAESPVFPGTESIEFTMATPGYPEVGPPSEDEDHPAYGNKQEIKVKLPVKPRVKLPTPFSPMTSVSNPAVIMPAMGIAAAQALVRQQGWQGLIDNACGKNTAIPKPVNHGPTAHSSETFNTKKNEAALPVAASTKDNFDMKHEPTTAITTRFPPADEPAGLSASRWAALSSLSAYHPETKPSEEELVEEREFGSSPTINMPNAFNPAVLNASPPRRYDNKSAQLEYTSPFSKSSRLAPIENASENNGSGWNQGVECMIHLPGQSHRTSRQFLRNVARANRIDPNYNARPNHRGGFNGSTKPRVPNPQPNLNTPLNNNNTNNSSHHGNGKSWSYSSKNGHRKNGGAAHNDYQHQPTTFHPRPVSFNPRDDVKSTVHY